MKIAKGHFGFNTIIKKILASCYRWPHFMRTLLKCTKLVTVANDSGQYGGVARLHSNL